MGRKLVLFAIAILVLIAGLGCAKAPQDGGDVVEFSNPPESQRFKGKGGPAGMATRVIELDHYLLGYGQENPRLHIEYANVSSKTIKIEIGIIWYIARDLVADQFPQHDIRPPVLPGQGETLVYTPGAGPPSKLVNYYVIVRSLWDEQLPHVSLGRIVEPTESMPIPRQVTSVSATLEKANLDQSELNELRRVLWEFLTHVKKTADGGQKQLLIQAGVLADAIRSDSELVDLIGRKTVEERLILDTLATAFAAGLSYWGNTFHGIDIPSPIGKLIAEGAEELGNRIAEWWWLEEVSLLNVNTITGTMDIVYDRRSGEIWANVDVYAPMGQIYMYIPVEPVLVSPEGGGNVVLSEGVRPVIERCKIIYRIR